MTNPKGTTTFTKTYSNTHTYSYFGKQNNPPWNRRNTDLNAFEGTASGSSTGSGIVQIVFPYNTINADLNPGVGTVAIKSVTLHGTNLTTYLPRGNGAYALLGYSTQTPGAGTFDATSVTNRAVVKQWFTQGNSETFTLPASFATNFQGTGKFILLGNGTTKDLTEGGSWAGGPGSWKLTITYTVTI